MKKTLLFLLTLACFSFRVSATDIAIAAEQIPAVNIPNVGVAVTGTCTATNGNTTVTFSGAGIPARFVGLVGWQISLAGTYYYVATADSATSITLTASYSGSTSASTAYIIPPTIALQIYVSQPFVPNGRTYTVQSGAPGSPAFFKRVGASIRSVSGSNQLYLPAITLDATLDAPTPVDRNARYSAWFFRLDGSQIRVYDGYASFALAAIPTSTTWNAIRMYNTPGIPPQQNLAGYTTSQVDALIAGVAITGTPEYLVKIPADGTGGETAAAYQTGSDITFIGATDLKGGIPSAAFSSLPTNGRGNTSLYWDSTNKQLRAYNSTTGKWVAVNGNTWNVQDFGAYGDAYGETLEYSVSATNGSTAITSNGRFPSRWVGLTNITVNITHGTSYQAYTIASCASTSACTLSANYTGTTTTSARLLAYLYAAITGSSTTVTCSFCNFTSADAGKKVVIGGVNGAAAHVTTIASVTNATTAVLTAAPPTTSAQVAITFGTDDTTAISNALLAAEAGGGGNVNVPPGNYLINYVTLPKQTHFVGAGRVASRLVSYASSGGIVRSIWPSNSNTKVHSSVKHMGIRALDTNSFQSGIHENGGSFLTFEDLYIVDPHWGIILDQTEQSDIKESNIESYNLAGYGAYRSTHDPTNNSYWTKTGAQSTTTDGTYWRINTSATNATTYYTRALTSTWFQKGATVIGRGISVAGSDGASLPNDSIKFTIDNSTQAYNLQFTGTQVRLNGGTLRSLAVGSYWRLNIAVGGATATLYIDGVAVDSNVAFTTSSGSAQIGWGDFATTDDADAYWQDLQFYSSNPLPAGIWLVNGADVTVGNSGGYTNRITISKSQVNAAAVQIADDGGYTHAYRDMNMNGGIIQIRMANAIGVEVSGGEYEGHVLNTISLAQTLLQGSVAVTGNSGISIGGGGIYSAWGLSGFPQIRLEEGTGVAINGNYFGSGNTHAIDIYDRNTVVRVDANANSFTTTSLFSSIPTYGTAIFTSTNTSAKESWQHRVATSRLATEAITGNQITSNQNDYDPSGEGSVLARSAYRLSSDASRNITGLLAGREGQIVTIVNVGSFDIVLKHQDASSSAANRFLSAYGLDITIGANMTALLKYDSTTGKWRASLVD